MLTSPAAMDATERLSKTNNQKPQSNDKKDKTFGATRQRSASEANVLTSDVANTSSQQPSKQQSVLQQVN